MVLVRRAIHPRYNFELRIISISRKIGGLLFRLITYFQLKYKQKDIKEIDIFRRMIDMLGM